jgi:hypothetical protein
VAQGLKARVALVQNWQVASANAILARSGKSLMTNAAYVRFQLIYKSRMDGEFCK